MNDKNKGSGLIAVIITVTVIALLGATVLYMSYLNSMVKGADRSARRNFYETEKWLDEIRAEVQVAVSKSLNKAYADMMESYHRTIFEAPDGVSSEEALVKLKDEHKLFIQKYFAEAFVDAFTNPASISDATWTYDVEAGGSEKVLKFTTPKYSEIVFKLTQPPIPELDNPANHPSVGGSHPAKIAIPNKILLNVMVASTDDAQGYYNEIHTGFEINIPTFTPSTTGVYSSLKNRIIIADGTLRARQLSELTGSIGVGAIDVVSNLLIHSGQVVVGGQGADAGIISIKNSATLTLDAGELWAKKIQVGSGVSGSTASGTLVLNASGGAANIADDLEMNGNGSKAELFGNYYGFSNSKQVGKASSSMIVNGKDAELKLEGLDSLRLAGYSFITDENKSAVGSDGKDIAMAGSLTVRRDQTIYLVPEKLITGIGITSNPNIVATADPAPVPTIVPDGELWRTPAPANVPVKLSDYGVSVKTLKKPLPGSTTQSAVYYFMEFDTAENRDRFFTDYFDHYRNNIKEYLQEYVKITGLSNSNDLNKVAAPGTLWNNTFDLVHGTMDLVDSSALTENTYTYLWQTLTKSSSDSQNSMFSHYVQQNELRTQASAKPQKTLEFEMAGKTLALFIDNEGGGDYNIGAAHVSNYPDVNVVIATGNVIVTQSFHGLIIAQGDVIVQANVTDDAGVFPATEDGKINLNPAFSATITDDSGVQHPLWDYTRNFEFSPSSGASEQTWNMNDLVRYTDWTKNEESPAERP
ncbi:hypothetical protein LQZ18_07230 [Lachnospiraceae bacterium ZAX-1]